MFTFSLSDVRNVLERGQKDAVANGGYRVPYQGISPETKAGPGLWLVGDEGVYLISNGKLSKGQRPLVVYAEECNPKTNPDCWHYKRQHFGGDDGVEFIDAALIQKIIASVPDATHLQIRMDDASMSFDLIRR